MSWSLFTKKTKIQKFWEWFSIRSDKYFQFEGDEARLFSELKSALTKVNPSLVFEFGPITKEGTREFVVSAGGIVSVFPVVSEMFENAPSLPKWKIIAFRQPRPEISRIEIEGLGIDLEDVFFEYSVMNGMMDLLLYIKGFKESPEFTVITFILLDNLLGEHDVEMYVGSIEKFSLDESHKIDLKPISILPEIMRAHKLGQTEEEG